MKLSELIGTKSISPDPEVFGITHDSREVREGYLFVAIKGKQTDGHIYLKDVYKRGAVAAVVQRINHGIPLLQIQVEDTRVKLAELSSRFYGHPSKDLTVIGITGTNGKTTTAYMMATIFKNLGIKAGVITTIEYQTPKTTKSAYLTTPEAPELQMLLEQIKKEGGTHVIMEVSSHSVSEHRIDYMHFDYGIFTKLGRDHLDYHGTLDAYRNAKADFIRRVNHGVALNADDEEFEFMKGVSSAKDIVSYGLHNGDLRCKIIENDIRGLSVKIEGLFQMKIRLRTPGKFNAYNLLAAFAICWMLGIEPDEMASAIKGFKGVPGRFEVILPRDYKFQVIIDYAHTPDALETLLRSARELNPRRILTLFGAGGNRDRGKRPLMGEVASRLSDVVIITSDNPREEHPMDIIRDILSGIQREEDIYVVPDRKEAIVKALNLAQEGDLILLAGKGHEDYMVIGNKKIPFSEKEIVYKTLGVKADA